MGTVRDSVPAAAASTQRPWVELSKQNDFAESLFAQLKDRVEALGHEIVSLRSGTDMGQVSADIRVRRLQELVPKSKALSEIDFQKFPGASSLVTHLAVKWLIG